MLHQQERLGVECTLGSGVRWDLERTGPGRPDSDSPRCLETLSSTQLSPRSSPPDPGPSDLSSLEAKVTSISPA